MLSCYTLDKFNKVKPGILIRRSLVDNYNYIQSDGTSSIKIPVLNSETHSKLHLCEFIDGGRLKELEPNDELNISGILLLLNWKSEIGGSFIESNVSELEKNGQVKIITSSEVFNGMSLDFTKELYTPTYMLNILKDCNIKYHSVIHSSEDIFYTTNQYNILSIELDQMKITMKNVIS